MITLKRQTALLLFFLCIFDFTSFLMKACNENTYIRIDSIDDTAPLTPRIIGSSNDVAGPLDIFISGGTTSIRASAPLDSEGDWSYQVPTTDSLSTGVTYTITVQKPPSIINICGPSPISQEYRPVFQPPIISYPISNGKVLPSLFTITGSVQAGVTQVSIAIDGTIIAAAVPVVNNSFSYAYNPIGLALGDHLLQVTANGIAAQAIFILINEQDGILDTSYGVNGIANSTTAGTIQSLAIMSNGTSVGSGISNNNLTLAFGSSSGTLSFVNTGIAAPNPLDIARVAIQPFDNKIIVALTTGGNFKLYRFNIDGLIDSSFNVPAMAGSADDMTIQGNRIYVAATITNKPNALIYSTNGNLISAAVGPVVATASAIAVNPAGTPFITSNSAGNTYLDVFASSATTHIQINDADILDDIALFNNFIYLAGAGTINNAGIWRLNADLTLDSAYNTTVNNELLAILPAAGEGIKSLVVQGDGKLIMNTLNPANPGQSGFIARFNNDGSLDNWFNTTGYNEALTYQFTDMVLEQSGRIITSIQTMPTQNFALAAYTNFTAFADFAAPDVPSSPFVYTSPNDIVIGVKSLPTVLSGNGPTDTNVKVAIINNDTGVIINSDTTVDNSGKWNTQPVSLTDGTYTVDAKASLGASGTLFGTNGSFTVNTVIPSVADVVSSPNGANISTSSISGTALAGSAIQAVAGSMIIAETTSNNDGTWQLTQDDVIIDPSALFVQATNAIGNESPPSELIPVNLFIMTEGCPLPTPPTVPVPAVTCPEQPIPIEITITGSPLISIEGESGSILDLYGIINGSPVELLRLGTIPAGTTNFSYFIPEGILNGLNIYIIITDPQGNVTTIPLTTTQFIRFSAQTSNLAQAIIDKYC